MKRNVTLYVSVNPKNREIFVVSSVKKNLLKLKPLRKRMKLLSLKYRLLDHSITLMNVLKRKPVVNCGKR